MKREPQVGRTRGVVLSISLRKAATRGGREELALATTLRHAAWERMFTL